MKDANATAHKGQKAVARMGYIAKGVVYLLIGGLAIMAAVGLGGKNASSKEAINSLASQPFGGFMLGVLGIGLCGYTIWRFVQAWSDTENKGSDAKGIVTRIGFVISGITYAGLGVYCFDIILNAAYSSGGSTEDRTAKLMSYPGGVYLVFAVGLVFIGVGIRQIWRAVKRSYLKNWHTQEMSRHQLKVAEGITRWGLSARGVVFMIIGGFLCLAAWNTNPDQAEGLGGALSTLASQPFGPWLLGIVALGLISYGGYCLLNARFRDVS